eukprot:CAMPEP_0194274124 /NCGR_PEP_ID=MMETSP0169-20130528/7290_1 /TAXON_ID=218684 /ORGANISM="Corethron pennatum, Strain L29A3" /LENGTH=111 /DNA_ID=CAMNT_0039017241 /DNA_START=192 /DNA_END=524 /DNA_ORIENTATION=-
MWSVCRLLLAAAAASPAPALGISPRGAPAGRTSSVTSERLLRWVTDGGADLAVTWGPSPAGFGTGLAASADLPAGATAARIPRPLQLRADAPRLLPRSVAAVSAARRAAFP